MQPTNNQETSSRGKGTDEQEREHPVPTAVDEERKAPVEESDLADYGVSETEEEEEKEEGDRDSIFRAYPGNCDAAWCKMETDTKRKCSSCDKYVHDACDAGEVEFSEFSLSKGRSQSKMACSRECFVVEMGLPSDWTAGRSKQIQATAQIPQKNREQPPKDSEDTTQAQNETSKVTDDSDLVLGMQGLTASASTRHRQISTRKKVTETEILQILDSEDEDGEPGPPIPVLESDVLDAPKVNAGSYRQILTEMDIALICDPPKTLRVIDPKHVGDLKNDFKRRGFLPVVGTISVALKQDPKRSPGEIKALHEAIQASGKIEEEVWLVDGRNRHTALTELGAEDAGWAEAIKSLRVTLWRGLSDGEYVSHAEILGLGAVLNASNSNVKKMSFSDSVHGTVSSYNVMASRNPHVDMTNLPDSAIATALKKMNVLPNLSDRQILRYTLVGRNLAERPEWFKIFLEVTNQCGQLGIEHMSSKVLFETKEPSFFDLALHSVADRILNKSPGSFADIRDRFYTFIAALYRHLQAICDYKDIEIEDLYKIEFNATSSSSRMTLEQSFRLKLTGYQFNEDKKPDTVLKKTAERMKGIDKWIMKAVGPDILPAPTPSPEDYPTQAIGDEVVEVSTRTGDGGERGSGPGSGTVGGTGAGGARSGGARNEGEPVRKSSRKRKIRVLEDVDIEVEPSVRRTRSRGKTGGPRKKLKTGDEGMTELKQTLQNMDKTQLVDLMTELNAEVVFHASPDGEADEGEKFEPATREFEDSLPEGLPIGYEDPVPYTGTSHPKWTRYAITRPNRWPKRNPLEHVSPYLQAVHVPDQHRGHVVIKELQVLRDNHHVVFWRAAHNYFLESPEEIDHCIMNTGEDLGAYEGEDKIWLASILSDEVALEYFGKRREQLMESGFCVLEGFLDDHRMPRFVGPSKQKVHVVMDPTFYIRLHKETEGMFPGGEALKKSGNRTIWNGIVNSGGDQDALDGENGIGRFTSTKHGLMNVIEQDVGKVWMCRNRALLDLRIGQCIAAMKIGDNFGGKGVKEMYTPNTGGRWLVTSKECKRQQLHTDFESMSRTETLSRDKLPGFFVLCTAETEVPIWVCPNSHTVVASARTGTLGSVSRGMVCGMVNIPPFSIFVGRGDVFHCGAGFDDYLGDSGQLRYHLYFVPKDKHLPDGVHLNMDFKPRFRANIDDGTDEEVDAREPLELGGMPEDGEDEEKEDEEMTEEGVE